jgi:hypothetical protein
MPLQQDQVDQVAVPSEMEELAAQGIRHQPAQRKDLQVAVPLAARFVVALAAAARVALA